jgi:NAD(P)-dependent dehydrogenase (short-subunit alcohol dehydrogenase family)
MARLAGKTALVTGASRNTGRAIALRFAAEGANVVLGAKSAGAELDAVADECRSFGVESLAYLADVASIESVNAMVHAGLERFGAIDVLASTVAIRPHTPITELSAEEWSEVLGINLCGTFYLVKAIVPSMIERKSGSIIAIGGLSAVSGTNNATASAASKAGLLGLIRALAVELGPHGIRANMVVPGNIDTVVTNPEWHPNAQRGASASNDRSPLRRAGRPDEIASACLFLASDDGSYVTGEHLMCNGGRFID